MEDLLIVFAIGVLGSAHCVGMCGGLVAAVAVTGSARTALPRQLAYHAGKTATYILFGAVAGLAGQLLTGLFTGLQGALGLGLGAVLVLTGLALCWPGARLGSPAFSGRAAALLGAGVARLVGGGAAATFGLGMLNGLLPCALVYGMLAKATATGTALGGALVMGTFGAATVPALLATGLAGRLVSPALRQRLQRTGGVLVVVLGLLVMARGASALGGPEAPAPVQWHCSPGGA
ncbi:MAG: sulfite exporter TauE/SafE family protein [Rubricoccaceae bacterium]